MPAPLRCNSGTGRLFRGLTGDDLHIAQRAASRGGHAGDVFELRFPADDAGGGADELHTHVVAEYAHDALLARQRVPFHRRAAHADRAGLVEHGVLQRIRHRGRREDIHAHARARFLHERGREHDFERAGLAQPLGDGGEILADSCRRCRRRAPPAAHEHLLAATPLGEDDAQRVGASANSFRSRAEAAAHAARTRRRTGPLDNTRTSAAPVGVTSSPDPSGPGTDRVPLEQLERRRRGHRQHAVRGLHRAVAERDRPAVHRFDAELLEAPDRRRRRRESRRRRRPRADAPSRSARRGSPPRPSRSR